MVEIKRVVWENDFERGVKKLKNGQLKKRIKRQIKKISKNTDVGKPLRHLMKGERVVYVKPYRLIYAVVGNELHLLEFKHRKKAYRK